MDKIIENLPVFPLGVVLFPGLPMDLQIFEPRYLDLVRVSLKEQSPFAIAPILDGREVGVTPKIFPCGTLVSIIDWTQRDNGLLGVTVRGESRVRFESTHVAANNLLLADKATVVDEVEADIDDENRDLLDYLNGLISQAGGDVQYSEDTINLNELVWHLAYTLPIEKTDKCSLLEIADPHQRAHRLKQFLWRLSHKN